LPPDATDTDHDPANSRLDPILRAGVSYWEGKCAGRRMPLVSDIDPLEMPFYLLPWLILTDVLRDPLDFRYRLIGSGIVQMSRRDYTGQRFSELPHAGPGNQVWEHRATVVQTCKPLFTAPPYTGPIGSVRKISGVHLPLGDENVVMILTAVVYNR